MEAYKSTCPDCKVVYFWTGFKTGIGKTPEQLEEMERKRTVCRECGSKMLKTELDMESEMGKDLQEQYRFVADILTGGAERKQRSNECPTCHEPAVVTCRCPLGDSECKNGHHWHRCPVHGVVLLGAADHGGDTVRCRCPGGAGSGIRGINEGDPAPTRKSHIQGTGWGSDHVWIRGHTGFDKCTAYECAECGVEFYHHYEQIPDIFKAMQESGVPEKCSRSKVGVPR